MARASVNFTVRHPTGIAIELGREYDAELCDMVGLSNLPAQFKARLVHLIGSCRQCILRKTPTKADGDRALNELAQTLRKAFQLMGQVGDALAHPLGCVRRQLPGGLDEYRQRQADIEHLADVVEQVLYVVPPPGLDTAPVPVMVANAKASLAAGIAELLADYDIKPTTTIESPYLRLVEFALLHVDPKRPGDTKAIAGKGLYVWRGHGARRVQKMYLPAGCRESSNGELCQRVTTTEAHHEEADPNATH